MRKILALVIAVIATNLLTLAAVYAFGHEKNVYCSAHWVRGLETIFYPPDTRVLDCHPAADAGGYLLCEPAGAARHESTVNRQPRPTIEITTGPIIDYRPYHPSPYAEQGWYEGGECVVYGPDVITGDEIGTCKYWGPGGFGYANVVWGFHGPKSAERCYTRERQKTPLCAMR